MTLRRADFFKRRRRLAYFQSHRTRRKQQLRSENHVNADASGGTYVTNPRATTNALNGPAPAGTAYAIEIQNPTCTSATLAVYKIVSESEASLASTPIPCNNGMTVRVMYTAETGQIAVFINNALGYLGSDSSIAGGKPGIGVRGPPSGNSI